MDKDDSTAVCNDTCYASIKAYQEDRVMTLNVSVSCKSQVPFKVRVIRACGYDDCDVP